MPAYDAKYEFYQFFLPYCLQRQADGRYAVLNRKGKPVGLHVRAQIEYDDFPVLVKMRMSKATAQKLSWNHSENTENIYLYNDGTTPTGPEAEAYFARLAHLAGLQVKVPR